MPLLKQQRHIGYGYHRMNLKNIRTWVVNTLGVEVIFSHGTGPRPNGQYAVVNILSISKPIEDVRSEIRQGNGDITASYDTCP